MIQSLLFMAGGLPAEYWFRTFQSTAKPCGIATGPSNQIHYFTTTSGSSCEYGTLNKYGSPTLSVSKTFDLGSTTAPFSYWNSTFAYLRRYSPISDDGSGNPSVIATCTYDTGDPDYLPMVSAASKVASAIVQHSHDDGSGVSDFGGNCIDASSGTRYVAGYSSGNYFVAKSSWAFRAASSAYPYPNVVDLVSDGSYVYALSYKNDSSGSDAIVVKHNSSNGTVAGYVSFSSYPAYCLSLRNGFLYVGASAGNASFCKINTSSWTVVWNKYAVPSGGASQNTHGVAADSSGNVYALIYGYSFGYPMSSLLVKTDSSGALLWSRALHNTHPVSLRVDSSDAPVVMVTPLLGTGLPNTDVTVIARLPADGSGTGSYTIGSGTTFSVTYANPGTVTLYSASNVGLSSLSLSNSASTYSEASGTDSDAGQTFTSTKKDIA